MVRLRPMLPSEFGAFRKWLIRDYARSHVVAGTWTRREAAARSRREIDQLLTRGVKTPSHYLRAVAAGEPERRVGEVWYAVQREGVRTQLFIFWLGIDRPYRGRGFGGATLRLLEPEAVRLGARRIALHVFGDNVRAQQLYRRIGYEPTHISMTKPVRSGRAAVPAVRRRRAPGSPRARRPSRPERRA